MLQFIASFYTLITFLQYKLAELEPAVSVCHVTLTLHATTAPQEHLTSPILFVDVDGTEITGVLITTRCKCKGPVIR